MKRIPCMAKWDCVPFPIPPLFSFLVSGFPKRTWSGEQGNGFSQLTGRSSRPSRRICIGPAGWPRRGGTRPGRKTCLRRGTGASFGKKLGSFQATQLKRITREWPPKAGKMAGTMTHKACTSCLDKERAIRIQSPRWPNVFR